jgi:5-methylcytosine-specific restriction protein A
MTTRPCLDCSALVRGRPGSKQGTRCPRCQAARDQAKRATRPHTYAEDQRRAQVVQAWRAKHGDWCPGWQRPPHPATDLTADHVVAFAVVGHELSDLVVLCRSCNGAKGKRSG